jgi:hypothetical protein
MRFSVPLDDSIENERRNDPSKLSTPPARRAPVQGCSATERRVSKNAQGPFFGLSRAESLMGSISGGFGSFAELLPPS